MKDLKDMTAAELVAELAEINRRLKVLDIFASEDVMKHYKLRVAAITAELDARCSRWGLKIGYDNERTYIGRPQKGEKRVFKDEIIPYVEIGMISDSCYDQDSYGDISGVVSVTIRNPAEVHALLGYLLSKEVKP